MTRSSESPASPRRVTTKIKEQKALEYRKAGLGYDAIAALPLRSEHPKGHPDYKPLYRDKSGAKKAVARALARIEAEAEETAHEVLALELARLDEMHAGLWLRAIRQDSDPKIVQTVLSVQQQRSRYLGLDFADGLDERFLAVQEGEAARVTDAWQQALVDQGLTAEQVQEVMARAAHHLGAGPGPSASGGRETADDVPGPPR